METVSENPYLVLARTALDNPTSLRVGYKLFTRVTMATNWSRIDCNYLTKPG